MLIYVILVDRNLQRDASGLSQQSSLTANSASKDFSLIFSKLAEQQLQQEPRQAAPVTDIM